MDNISCLEVIKVITRLKEDAELFIKEFWENGGTQLIIQNTPKSMRKKIRGKRRISKFNITIEALEENQTAKNETRYNLRTRNQRNTNSTINDTKNDTKQNDTKNGLDYMDVTNTNDTLIGNDSRASESVYFLRPKTFVKYDNESSEECQRTLKVNNKLKEKTIKQKGTKTKIIDDKSFVVSKIINANCDIPITNTKQGSQNLRKRKSNDVIRPYSKSDEALQPNIKLIKVEDMMKESTYIKQPIHPGTPSISRVQPNLALKLNNCFNLEQLQNDITLDKHIPINHQKRFFNTPDNSLNPVEASKGEGSPASLSENKKKSDDGYSTCSTNTERCATLQPNIKVLNDVADMMPNIQNTPSKKSPFSVLNTTLKKCKQAYINSVTRGISILRPDFSDIESSPKQNVDKDIVVDTVCNVKTINIVNTKKQTPSASSLESQIKVNAVAKLCGTIRGRFNSNKKPIIQRTPSVTSLKSLNRNLSSSSSTDSMNLPKPISYIQKYQMRSASKNDLDGIEREQRQQEEERKKNLARSRKDEAVKKRAEEAKLKNEKKQAFVENERIRREEEERLRVIEEKALYDKKMEAIEQAKAQKQLEKDIKRQKKLEKEQQAKERRDEEERKKLAEAEIRRLKEEQETKRIQQQKEAELRDKAEKAAEYKRLQELKRAELEEKNRLETERLRILEEKRIELEKQREKEKKDREKKEKEELEHARLEKYRRERQLRLLAEQEARDRVHEAERIRKAEEERVQREQKKKEEMEAREHALEMERQKKLELLAKERFIEAQKQQRLEFENKERAEMERRKKMELEFKERNIELERQKRAELEAREHAREMDRQKKIALERAQQEQRWRDEEAARKQKMLKMQIDEHNSKITKDAKTDVKLQFALPTKPATKVVYKVPLNDNQSANVASNHQSMNVASNHQSANVASNAENYLNYSIDDLREDESDDEDKPKKKKVPTATLR